jgi:hypothetical protein
MTVHWTIALGVYIIDILKQEPGALRDLWSLHIGLSEQLQDPKCDIVQTVHSKDSAKVREFPSMELKVG